MIPTHKTYVEPFAGGMAVLLAKSRAQCEVINDVDQNLVNFYRFVKHHKKALFMEMEGYLNSRADFYELRKNPGITDLQKAARWFLVKVCSFGAKSESWGRGKSRYAGFDLKRHFKLIDAVAARLNRVLIENKDWEEIVDFFDTPDTFFFFDPPYVDCGRTAYDPFTESDMKCLCERIKPLKGNWLLTCDDSIQCRSIFRGLPFIELHSHYSLARASGTRKPSKELLIISPKLNIHINVTRLAA